LLSSPIQFISTQLNTIHRFKQSIGDSINVKQELLLNQNIILEISQATESILAAIKLGNRVIFAGNGGSAADAQHLAAEFVSGFEFDRPGLPALSLSTDTSMLTAIGYDYGYDKLFLRQLQAQARPGDVFVGITTSGKSPNVLRAFEVCKDLQVTSIALCGLGEELEGKVDHVIRVPSLHTPRIQECHILIGHMICAEIELQMFGHLAPSQE
jgi:D-sedoheptulose 7-phosphate isomerase